MKSNILSFLSTWEYMNPSFRPAMEDVTTVNETFMNDPNLFYASILDGHGGCSTASFASSRLYLNIVDGLKQEELKSMKDIFRYAFLLTDIECRTQGLIASGCTCAVVLLERNAATQERIIHCANVGDSRVVICDSGNAIRLSYDHKADDPSEMKRIYSSGGMVINKRVMGLLAVSRSIGDQFLKDFVIGEPHIDSYSIKSTTAFIVIACDGVYDVMSDEDVCRFISQCISRGKANEASKSLVEEAIRRGSRDNVSAIVIGL